MMTTTEIKQLVLSTLDDMKAEKVTELNVADLTDIAETMIIASGTSGRHVRALANGVVSSLKAKDVMPIGVEGEEEASWVLVDLGDIVVHVMQHEAREFYSLEKLWSEGFSTREQA